MDDEGSSAASGGALVVPDPVRTGGSTTPSPRVPRGAHPPGAQRRATRRRRACRRARAPPRPGLAPAPVLRRFSCNLTAPVAPLRVDVGSDDCVRAGLVDEWLQARNEL